MTVRVIVTASGRVTFEGSGYAPEGPVRAEARPIDGPLRIELERALAVADRANNATVQRARRPMDRAGRSHGRRAAGGRAQGGLSAEALASGCPASARCRFRPSAS